MRRRIGIFAGFTLSVLVWSGGVAAQTQPARCPGTPERLEGHVVKVDVPHGKVTVRSSDGTVHELEASRETLQGYKVGDHLQATLRSAPNCK